MLIQFKFEQFLTSNNAALAHLRFFLSLGMVAILDDIGTNLIQCRMEISQGLCLPSLLQFGRVVSER